MSKQSDAKEKQGYVDKFIPKTCSNCGKYMSDFVPAKTWYGSRTVEKNLRCAIGGFKVKKMCVCNEWIERTEK